MVTSAKRTHLSDMFIRRLTVLYYVYVDNFDHGIDIGHTVAGDIIREVREG